MKTSEFKAWFEGFAENLDGAPTKAQFAKIKAKVDEIDGTPVTEVIYLDRYVQPWRPYWDKYWTAAGVTTGKSLSSGSLIGDQSVVPMNFVDGAHIFGLDRDQITFDSHAAMRELGRMEANRIAV